MADVWIASDEQSHAPAASVDHGPRLVGLIRQTLARELIRRRELRAHAQLGVRVDADRTAIDAAHRTLRAQYEPTAYARYGADTVAIAARIVALVDDSHAYMRDATPLVAASVARAASDQPRVSLGERARLLLRDAFDRFR